MIRQKDKTLAIVLALFTGGIGIHKFYLDRPGAGIMYALFCWTLIPGLCAIFDTLTLLFMTQAKFDQKYNGA